MMLADKHTEQIDTLALRFFLLCNPKAAPADMSDADRDMYRPLAEYAVAELTTRPEPAADAVYELATKIATVWGHADAFDDNGPAFDSNVFIGIRRRAFKAAEIALQATAVEPEPGLDAVEWEEIHVSKGDDGTGVVIEVEGVPDSRGRHVVIATGATLGEAVAAAVRQATGAEGERE